MALGTESPSGLQEDLPLTEHEVVSLGRWWVAMQKRRPACGATSTGVPHPPSSLLSTRAPQIEAPGPIADGGT